MSQKKALAVISFGTTYPEARAAIARIEDDLRAALPGHDFFRAFTSGMVIRKIAQEEGLVIPTPGELLDRLADEGYTEVVCQSLHVMPGIEYEKMCAQLEARRARFVKLTIGRPLLTGEADYQAVCAGLLPLLPALGDEEAWVYMGHGTEHFANAAYSQLENTFRAQGAERIYVGTVEGFPGLDYVQERLHARGARRVHLAPFMIVAGDHARNDLAGDEPDSWKSLLEADGFAVEAHLQGLGEVEPVRALFVRHCLESLQEAE